ncbi:hypothetical protein [Bacillus mycoides]|uniref:hypothetical protein n=1 Tax=Bacillus mycoides TaxID=1405 RepID=UPI003D653140
MRIGRNVLSMDARQSLYENKRRMKVALSMVSQASQIPQWFQSYCSFKYNL